MKKTKFIRQKLICPVCFGYEQVENNNEAGGFGFALFDWCPRCGGDGIIRQRVEIEYEHKERPILRTIQILLIGITGGFVITVLYGVLR